MVLAHRVTLRYGIYLEPHGFWGFRTVRIASGGLARRSVRCAHAPQEDTNADTVVDDREVVGVGGVAGVSGVGGVVGVAGVAGVGGVGGVAGVVGVAGVGGVGGILTCRYRGGWLTSCGHRGDRFIPGLDCLSPGHNALRRHTTRSALRLRVYGLLQGTSGHPE